MANEEIIYKLLSVLLSSLAIISYKAVISGWFYRRSRLKADYELTKNFISEVIKGENPHPLVIERGFYAVMGKKLNADIIQHLLLFRHPDSAVYNYSKGGFMVDFDYENHKFSYKQKYNTSLKRWWAKQLRIIGYLAFFYFALAPLFFSDVIISRAGASGFVLVLFCLIGFGSVAIGLLREHDGFKSAEELLTEQNGCQLIEEKVQTVAVA